MITIDHTALAQFLAEPSNGPITMLNLLRFSDADGRAIYEQYLQAAGPVVERHGGEIIFAGNAGAALASEPGQSWDGVALVRYPSRQAFADLAADPAYAAADKLRLAAVSEVTLQPVDPS